MNNLTIQEAADRMGLTLRRIQQMCKTGELSGAFKEGRKWMIPADSIPEPTKQSDLSAKQQDRSTNQPDTFSYQPDLASPSRIAEPGPGMLPRGKKPLPIGISSYVEAVTRYYYVDKTLMIRDLLDSLPKVSLFTRPRRFGKTLNMDMLRVFFEHSEIDTSVYFRDMQIWQCGDTYRQYQGQYPVIFMSFKDVKYRNWADTRQALWFSIASEYNRHSELEDSTQCTGSQKALYRCMTESQEIDDVTLIRALYDLSAMLHRHYHAPCIIIVDEYDTPIQQGYSNGYYQETIDFMRNFFSYAFKDNPHLAFGFLTGILRVSKESIFSGMNNLKVNTILDNRFSSYFGFTHEEVRAMLHYYGEDAHYEEALDWYDGYRFGSTEIFNPWSMLNYIDDLCTPKAFWQATGSHEIISELLASATPDILEQLRVLMQGGTISSYVDTSVIYPEIGENIAIIYSFLLVAGYLKCTGYELQEDGSYMCDLAIPNKEISYVFHREILNRFRTPQSDSISIQISQALFHQDPEAFQKALESYLMTTVSTFDTGNESFYQGLLLGLCAMLTGRYEVRSNRESGLGRFDIQLLPLRSGLPGFILELKSVPVEKNVRLESQADKALKQIQSKLYDTELHQHGVSRIICLGVAFCGKQVAIRSSI